MAETFLVGTDGSDCARRAAEFAAQRARAEGAAIVLLAVVEWSRYAFYTPEELEGRSQARKAEIEKANTQVLEPLKAKLASDQIEVKTLVRHGHAADVLGEVCKEEGASQIFIGRHGRSRLEQALFGSVTVRLLQSANVPVTVVP